MKNIILLVIITLCSYTLCGCSPNRPDNETLIKYRNGKLENSSVMIDGALYYSGEDGVYDQENQRIIETEKKPLLLQRDKNIYVVDGINVTEYDTAFQKQSGFELPEQPSAFAIANHSIFYTDEENYPHVIEKQTLAESLECKPSVAVPAEMNQESISVHYYPEFIVTTDMEGGITAIDTKSTEICVTNWDQYSTPILSVSDERLIYGTQRYVTKIHLILYPFSNPKQEKITRVPGGYMRAIEQYICNKDVIVITGFEDEGVRYSPEDLRGLLKDCYCKIDPKNMQIITQYTTDEYERILYADENYFAVLEGDKLRTYAADTHKEVYSQKTDLFRNGGDFTFETSPNKIYVFDNVSNQIVGIFSV